MRRAVVGILAHVDAGKTTLAEAMLYLTGKVRKLGRVDRGDTLMDTHELERARGITIFAGQAPMTVGDLCVHLLDTPGHVDFSAETERILNVLDYAILVISGTDGVQAHTRTLWKLLELYRIPTFLFITKMDFARREQGELMTELKRELSDRCTDFSGDLIGRDEELALCREDVMESYLAAGRVEDAKIQEIINDRLTFPCFFGSGLKLDGVETFLQGLETFVRSPSYPETFGARVYKISHDAGGAKLTHMKVTGGVLRVRDTLTVAGETEKVGEIRLYSGARYVTAEEAPAGSVCTVVGLCGTRGGQGLGSEEPASEPVLEPVMNYRIGLPAGVDAKDFLPRLRQLEEEDPMLRITWNERLQEIGVSLMGEVQVEILKSLIAGRFDVAVTIDHGRVQYKETITDTVEGVGHYEPLRHYAEVHVILSPLERGRGLVFERKCRDDSLDPTWQRLIMTHLCEKQHLGVLTGSPVTDMKITLAAGRAHVKHTEGGDFRQATYRAVRQGLMRAQSVILEPYYRFRLEVPPEQVGRAISDIRLRSGTFSAPEDLGDRSLLCGTAPVSTMNDYGAELAAYTSGRGRIQLTVCGYDICHDPQKVRETFAYHPESDLDNTPDSVFCAHGGGFPVKWDQVERYMHLESCLAKKEEPYRERLKKRHFRIEEDELEAILEREFGHSQAVRTLYQYAPTPTPKKPEPASERSSPLPRKKHLIVDGYNCIFAWEELKEIAGYDIGKAREALADRLCNYAAFTHNDVVLVFDGYNVKGNPGERINYHNIHIVYTKEYESGDIYIQKLVAEIGKNENVRVVTSDGLIQLSALGQGVLRMSSGEFEREVASVEEQIGDFLESLRKDDRRPPQ